MPNFITNHETTELKKRLIDLIKHSEELKFLVGFFYFSGIRELFDGLKSNPDVRLKVLVGLNVDQSNYGLLEFAENNQISDEESTYKFFESIKKSLNNENFDTREFYEQVKYFIGLIQDDKLIIRKSFKANHAKLYLFNLDSGQVGKRKLFITGSSNLTKAGLSTQNEFNVEISDYGFDDAEKYFDDLWDEAVKITEYEDVKMKLIKVVEKETLVKDITPFEAYCLVLKTYLDSFEQKNIGQSLIKTLEDNGYKTYQYQLDAVKQTLAIIEQNNGVIIADVVGLGKTIIACAVAKQMKKRGIIICPPGLVGDRNRNSGWKKYVEEFRLQDWEVRSLGDLESTLEYVNRIKEFEIVIIDEAHRFRNQDTQDYELLKNICRDKQVMLLTATPFNNRPGDILSLLKLFITPKKSSITLENNLVDQFKSFKGVFDRLNYIKKNWNSDDDKKRAKAQAYYKALFGEDLINLTKVAARARYLAKQIRNVIEPVTIRRNRLDLKKNPFYSQEVNELSEVAPPQEWFFALSKKQSNFYTKVLEDYFGEPDYGGRFKGAIYRPFMYEKIFKEDLTEEENRQFQQQRNLYDFMRRLLVKRFESSFGSFEQSIKNFKRIAITCQSFIRKTGEYIMDRALLEKIYKSDPDEIEKYLIEYEEKISKGEYPKNHKRYKIKNFKFANEFHADIESDIQLFNEVLTELEKLDLVNNDPKTACLIENLKSELGKKPSKGEPKRKIVIFSEYLDTVKYLEKSFAKHFPNKTLIIAGDLTQAKIKAINENFDASAAKLVNDYDLILSTDKISEGFNLNRAGMVINYDIPWNPVRVIQRLGRINRISKKVFNELYIVNFFPTEQGATLVKSREIAANKMFLIHNTLGEDSKIFDIDEEPTPAGLFNRVQKNSEELEEESFYTNALREFLRIKKEMPELINNLHNYPPRIKVAKNYDKNELIVFFKKGRLYAVAAETGQDKSEPYQTTFEDVLEGIACKSDEKALTWNTPLFWKTYHAIQSYRDFRLGVYSEQSLEAKALNKLEFLIRNDNELLMPYKDFLRTLKEDILSYGTLADFTLRRISNFKENNVNDLRALQLELGEDYLLKEKFRLKDQKKELIIAIQNISHP